MPKSEDRPAERDVAGSDQFLTLSLGGEMYAIHLLGVKEIIEYGNVTRVPTMPEFIRGVINLRGRVVPVVDLASRFGQSTSPVSRFTCIVIVEVATAAGTQDMGIVVDSVRAVLAIPDADIEPPPAFGARIRVDFIRGMWRADGRFAIILDVDRVLSVDEICEITHLGQQELAA
ncbi:MAG: chemotaxis protein CheW [Betaproteobacteria bacterium]|nr:chemotaxis protein CheW [Betaproteobacteria bacterium]